MTDEPTPPARPNAVAYLFAAGFLIAMVINMFRGGSDSLSIFLGAGGLALLGVDLGKLRGR